MYAKDLDDVNQKLRDKVDSINEKPFVINGKGSRKLNFDKYEKRSLKDVLRLHMRSVNGRFCV